MAENSPPSGYAGPSRKDKGKAKVGIEYEDLRISEDDDDDDYDDQETTSALQENEQGTDDHSAVVLPFKKLGADEVEVEDSSVGSPQEKSSTDQQEADDEVEEDEEDETDLKPGSRDVTVNEYRLSKTLHTSEVIPHNPQLNLGVKDASVLLDFPELVDFARAPLSWDILVFDGYDRRYDMLLKQQVHGGRIRYAISRGWGDFIRMHNLKAGDEITFYRVFDSRVSDVYFYVLRYFRKPMDRPPPSFPRNQLSPMQKLLWGSSSHVEDKGKGSEQQIEPKLDINQPDSAEDQSTRDQTERKVQTPGSRARTISEECCMEKTLTTKEVIEEDAKLYLDAYDASELTASPEIVNYPVGTYSKTLVVYDEDDKRYEMLLKHHMTSRGGTITIGYAISSGWGSFVRTHGLKAGDMVTFYRVLDESHLLSDDDYYYIVRYSRKLDNVKGQNESREKTINDGQDGGLRIFGWQVK